MNEYKCSETLCVSEFYQSKYKTLRAAFLEMSRIHNREKKEATKNRQRIIQACNDGKRDLDFQTGERIPSKTDPDVAFAKILGILGVSGYSDLKSN